MTVSDQIELLTAIENDRQTHKALLDNFKDYASKCPISGSEENAIVDFYRGYLKGIAELYIQIVRSVSEWLIRQP